MKEGAGSERGRQALRGRFRVAGERWRGAILSLRRRAGWLDALFLAAERFGRDQMSIYAGNFAYSSFLALVPLFLLLLSVLGFVFHSNPETMRGMVDALRERLPEIGAAIEDTAGGLERYRGLLGLAGLAGLAWAASRIVHSLKQGFARIWGYRARSSLSGRLRALPLVILLTTAGVIGVALSLASSSLTGWLGHRLGPAGPFLGWLLGLLGSMFVSTLILAMLYRMGTRTKPAWKEALWAAAVAALLLEAVQVALGFYFRALSGSQAFLGSLGIALGVIIWLYFVGVVAFLGAELAAALQERAWSPASPGTASRILPESDEEEDD